ncbi:hypothetical protein EVAR_39024_1 [Eumeta japonica]|uniref:Uncharacterized protein n=1 Tax=Eumeta variegata TaxID=151549 RepID=A0A4C1WPS7_EUMVA|nr:hypothetical protein EVAR_39024_1 [Eumeta japonica]
MLPVVIALARRSACLEHDAGAAGARPARARRRRRRRRPTLPRAEPARYSCPLLLAPSVVDDHQSFLFLVDVFCVASYITISHVRYFRYFKRSYVMVVVPLLTVLCTKQTKHPVTGSGVVLWQAP